LASSECAGRSARVLKGWTVVRVGRIGKRPTCIHCGSRLKKVKGEAGRLCPKCGPRLWPDWENQETDSRRWRLRFGVLHIPVSEFGFDNTTITSTHVFLGCIWNGLSSLKPFVRNHLRSLVLRAVVCGSRRRNGVIAPPLAHALKYTAKMPGSTPERLAEYERVLVGVRRYAVRGFLQGVVLEHEKRGEPKCPECKKPLRRVSGLGLVPLSEVEDIPFLPEEESREDYKDDEFCFYEPEEMAAHCAARAALKRSEKHAGGAPPAVGSDGGVCPARRRCRFSVENKPALPAGSLDVVCCHSRAATGSENSDIESTTNFAEYGCASRVAHIARRDSQKKIAADSRAQGIHQSSRRAGPRKEIFGGRRNSRSLPILLGVRQTQSAIRTSLLLERHDHDRIVALRCLRSLLQ
jgi:hypothetical protein